MGQSVGQPGVLLPVCCPGQGNLWPNDTLQRQGSRVALAGCGPTAEAQVGTNGALRWLLPGCYQANPTFTLRSTVWPSCPSPSQPQGPARCVPSSTLLTVQGPQWGETAACCLCRAVGLPLLAASPQPVPQPHPTTPQQETVVG